MRQLNKLKVAITAGIILLIIIAIVALVLKLNNSTYFSKETSIDTVINNINENIPIKNENDSGNTSKEFIIIDDNKNSNNNSETNNINNENTDKNGKKGENEEFTIQLLEYFKSKGIHIKNFSRSVENKWYSEDICLMIEIQLNKHQKHRDILNELRLVEGVRLIEEI